MFWSSTTLLLLHSGDEGKGLTGENTQCLFSPVQALISGWEKQQPVTFQLFLVCLCICECWFCGTVCLESFHSSGQVPQNPIGISGAWRRDLDPLPYGKVFLLGTVLVQLVSQPYWVCTAPLWSGGD